MSDDINEAQRQSIPPGWRTLDWARGFGRAIGPLYSKEEGEISLRAFRVEEHHQNGMGNAHGGMLMSFADMAWGNVVSLEKSAYWVTVRLTCDFISSARTGEWVEGGGELLHDEDGVYTVAGRIWTGERTLMTGTGVFKTLGPRPPRPGEKAYTG